MKAITALVLLVIVALVDSASASPQAVTLVAHNQRSSSGTRSTLVWKECSPSTNLAPCIGDPLSQWNIDNNVVGSDATWTWDSETGVLAATGQYWVTSYINSSPRGTSVISDKVNDLVIDTVNDTTNATSYECIEGTFLAGVNAAGCKTINLGFNTADDSVASWNVGGNPKCVSVSIGGDDYSLLDGQNAPTYRAGTPRPRGLTVQTAGQAGVGCNATSGAFDLWTVIDSGTAPAVMIPTGYTANQLLFISNGVDVIGCTLPVDIDCQGTNWMTFALAPVPTPAVGWLLGPAFGALGWFRRRRLTSN